MLSHNVPMARHMHSWAAIEHTEHNSRDSHQILLDDKDQQVHIAPGREGQVWYLPMPCTVQVISGFQLPYKSEKVLKTERALSVQVRVMGIDDDIQTDRTKVVKNNGLSDYYIQSSLCFFSANNNIRLMKIDKPQFKNREILKR